MKIREFVDIVKANDMHLGVERLISAKKYVAVADKIRIANDVIDLCSEYDRGFIKCDSHKKHLSFLFSVIEAHTDLVFADAWIDKMQEYDVLCEFELIDIIIDTFRHDYEASLLVLDMACNDVLANNSLEASVARLATSVSENLDVLVGLLADKIGNIDIEKIIPSDLDLNRLTGLLNKIK